MRDLTARKNLEAELRQSQKLEAIGSLAGGVAHDFNNILTVIVGYSEMMLAEPELPGMLRSDLREVRLAADRAATLTRQLLAFSRKQVLHPTVLSVNEAVGEMHGMLSRIIREDVRLETRLGAEVHPILVDRGQLEQVIMNLAVNARDAMPQGGTLVIETANVELDAAYGALHAGAAPGPHVVLSVTDTGTGMDAVTRQRLFEPFFTTKGAGHGTGLGLSTVYGIVQQSGGSIYVYSEPGRGTTFKIYFPRHHGALDEREVAPELPPVAAPEHATILLVEDDPTVRGAVRSMLERLGYLVLEAADGATALREVREGTRRPDAVLSDAMMPEMSGLELAEALLHEHPDLPILIMSGYAEDAVALGGRLAANVRFVEKPFTVRALSLALAEVLAPARS
jgi:nitrogen-specific signal transduction histidine kinase/CheY-like chemotaxis protein